MSTAAAFTPYANFGVFGQDGAATYASGKTLAADGLGGAYVAAYYDGSMRSRVFDASVALPTLNASFAPPGVNAYSSSPSANGLYQLDASGSNGVVGYYAIDSQTTAYHLGEVMFQLIYAAGSPDAGSPSIFSADRFLTLIISATPTGVAIP